MACGGGGREDGAGGETHNRQGRELPSVLIVDDEPQIVEFLRMGFAYEGFNVLLATSGLEGLQMALAKQPDAIILDIMLPVMSGLEIASRLRPSSDAAILMLTARDEVDDRVIGLNSGADDYVTKPFAFKELLAPLR